MFVVRVAAAIDCTVKAAVFPWRCVCLCVCLSLWVCTSGLASQRCRYRFLFTVSDTCATCAQSLCACFPVFFFACVLALVRFRARLAHVLLTLSPAFFCECVRVCL